MPIALDEVSFRYGSGRDILRRVSVSFPDRTSVAVSAPSGTGKSTLLGVIGLLLSPVAGRVLLDGREVTVADRASLLGGTIAWVLQGGHLLGARSAIDNVVLPALARGASRREVLPLAEALLDDMGLRAERDVPVSRLSGGEAQRVGIARALVTRPAVVLADEPTANLDVVTARAVTARLLAAAQHACVVVATHDPEVAARADRRLVLDAAGGLHDVADA